MQIYGAPEGTRGCNRLFFFFFFFLLLLLLFFFFHVPSGASNLYFSHSNFFIFSPFPGHQMFIFWPVENCTTWNLRYLMLRDAGWALRHWRSCQDLPFFLKSQFTPRKFSIVWLPRVKCLLLPCKAKPAWIKRSIQLRNFAVMLIIIRGSYSEKCLPTVNVTFDTKWANF